MKLPPLVSCVCRASPRWYTTDDTAEEAPMGFVAIRLFCWISDERLCCVVADRQQHSLAAVSCKLGRGGRCTVGPTNTVCVRSDRPIHGVLWNDEPPGSADGVAASKQRGVAWIGTKAPATSVDMMGGRDTNADATLPVTIRLKGPASQNAHRSEYVQTCARALCTQACAFGIACTSAC